MFRAAGQDTRVGRFPAAKLAGQTLASSHVTITGPSILYFTGASGSDIMFRVC